MMNSANAIRPPHALAVSVVGVAMLVAATVWMLANRVLLPVETMVVIGCLSFMLTCFSWASIETASFRASFFAFNAVTYVAVAMFLLVMIVQWNKPGQAFPGWATAVLGSCVLTASALTAYFAVRNFARWIRGGYNDAKKPVLH